MKRIWKNSPIDMVMLLLSIAQFAAMFSLASAWEEATLVQRAGGLALLIFMMTYNIIVISHLFTHTPWFESAMLNGIVSALNSFNIGQSVQAYQFTHVRNHHRYNNDRKGPDGRTKDLSSTFLTGKNGEHTSLSRYALLGALVTIADVGRAHLSGLRMWRVGKNEQTLQQLAAREPSRRAQELGQVQIDRMFHFAGMCVLVAISWHWTLFCYFPAFYVTLSLVNMQNYYEHFGALPEDRCADSASYYGRLYNFLTFNDGYHQEHHLRPQAHWSLMPQVRREFSARLDGTQRLVSPVPAVLGFFDSARPLLHRRAPALHEVRSVS
jgi:fatty acid desaturase